MRSDYKTALTKLVSNVKKEIPTGMTEKALNRICEILEHTPEELFRISGNFNKENFTKPVIPEKRSFRETLIHMLNIETLNYTTVYTAFLLDKPKIHPLHAERDIGRLALFENFIKEELLSCFQIERKKTLNFFKMLTPEQWSRQLIEENKQRQETIYWRARGLALHDFTHIQILKLQMDIVK